MWGQERGDKQLEVGFLFSPIRGLTKKHSPKANDRDINAKGELAYAWGNNMRQVPAIIAPGRSWGNLGPGLLAS